MKFRHLSCSALLATTAVMVMLPAELFSHHCGAALAAESTRQDAAPTPPLVDAPSLEELRPGRITILREGSALLRARGHVRPGPGRTWIFVLPTREPQPGPIEMFLMPSLPLAEMERLLRIGDEPVEAAVFEVTGEVFVYQGRNYLLPTFAPRLIAPIGPDELDAIDAASGREPARLRDRDPDSIAPPGVDDLVNDVDDPRALADDLDSVRQIMRDLEASVGPIARAGGVTMDERETRLRDGERIVNRRGRLRRDERGAWVFIFDADATGLADPPMTLLPCLMLEQMAVHARTHGYNLPMQISGIATVYGARNYLLPSMYTVPRHLTPLSR